MPGVAVEEVSGGSTCDDISGMMCCNKIYMVKARRTLGRVLDSEASVS